MRVLEVNNTAIPLADQVIPFVSGNNAVAINTSAESRTIQGSVDLAFTAPVTIATLAAAGLAGSVQQIALNYPYIRTSAAAKPIWLLQN